MAFVLIVAYLVLTIQIGLSSFFGAWGFLFLIAFFGFQALLTVKIAGKVRFEASFVRVLYCQVPLILCLLYSPYWPVLAATPFLFAVAGITLVFAAFNYRKTISLENLTNLILLSLPFALFFAFASGAKLIRFDNEWRLLAEEGQILGWVTKALHGGVAYRDMILTRGPLVIYSTALALRLSQVDLVHARAWILFLNLLMVYLYFFFCRTFSQSRALGFCALLAMFLVHEMSYRTGFAVATLAFFWKALQERSRTHGILCGISAALAVLSSVDAGASAAAALLMTSLAGIVFHAKERPAYLKTLVAMAMGFALLLAPLAIALALGRGLNQVIEGMLVYPRYAMMGFAAAPFPNLLNSFRGDVAQGAYWLPTTCRIFALFYLPVLIYLYTFFNFLRAATERRIDARNLMLLTLAFYGWFLFRSALGRSDLHHLYFSVPPALALALLHAESLKQDAGWKELWRHKEKLAGVALACLLPLWFLAQRPQDRVLPLVSQISKNVVGMRETDSSNRSFQTSRLWGIAAPSGTQRRIDRVVSAIESEKKPGDRVYAFPNLPLYYFLLDSPNPTRYEWAYQAITKSMRLEVVQDLARAKPQFVINSLDPHQRLDRIPASEAVPEILDFLRSHYKRWMTVGREEILVPKESTLRENTQDASPEREPREEWRTPEEGGEED